ncbi:MAG: CRISPR-associated endonuclease Cas2 [Planctomycetia bacterium]|nr:CRISPR-associated endonuclease Cas2 [Planctomycetia bacterium]
MRETVALVLFDIPTGDRAMRRQYTHFLSGLKRLGYLMLQESVYYKLLTNVSTFSTEQRAVQRIAPTEGTVQFLPIPLGTFKKMTALTGREFDMERLTAPIIEVGGEE